MKATSFILCTLVAALSWTSCGERATKTVDSMETEKISHHATDSVVGLLKQKYPQTATGRIERGVRQVASLWQQNDGGETDFGRFCEEHFIADEANRELLFNKLSRNFEQLFGHFSLMQMRLNEPVALEMGEVTPVDELFAAYSPSAHLYDDLYNNKVAFITALNFPCYTLEEKNQQSKQWSRPEWAYARMGELFTARVPANLNMSYAACSAAADNYISNYNIMMGELVNHDGNTLFPKEMKLLSHWNLRDEIKANYAAGNNGIEKQRMIYQVMNRIIDQTIPKEVINNATYQWNPFTNDVIEKGHAIGKTEESTERYRQIITLFNELKKQDPYFPNQDTYIKRNFNLQMEVAQEDVEKLFVEYLSDPVKQKVADQVANRLGRPLEPFDIWYDGFKQRSTISQDTLNKKTTRRFPNAEAFKAYMPTILGNLGFPYERAAYLSNLIEVDAARGSGHALGAQMKGDHARLRTRIGEKGMDYKGYNIAIHELGHNVEQTISLYDVDHYMLNGVPNTSFTEALAFMFQAKDLRLLHIYPPYDPMTEKLEMLDDYWSLAEIMGVGLVDIRIWKWLYQNPNATAEELKYATLNIAKEVWNEFFAPVYGQRDVTLLAIYSHTVSYPLYLSAYSFGHIIHFQLEAYLKGKNFATEIDRIYRLGRLTPDAWMQQAVGEKVSIQPILKATEEALKPLPFTRHTEY